MFILENDESIFVFRSNKWSFKYKNNLQDIKLGQYKGIKNDVVVKIHGEAFTENDTVKFPITIKKFYEEDPFNKEKCKRKRLLKSRKDMEDDEIEIINQEVDQLWNEARDDYQMNHDNLIIVKDNSGDIVRNDKIDDDISVNSQDNTDHAEIHDNYIDYDKDSEYNTDDEELVNENDDMIPNFENVIPLTVQDEEIEKEETTIFINGVGECYYHKIFGYIQSNNKDSIGIIEIEFALQCEANSSEKKVNSGKLLSRVSIYNTSVDLSIDRIDIFDGLIIVKGEEIIGHKDPFGWKQYQEARGVFINGWQSWSFCGSLNVTETQPKINLPYFSNSFHGNVVTKEDSKNNKYKYPFLSDMFGCSIEYDPLSSTNATVNKIPRSFCLLGFLSQREQFGKIKFDNEAGATSIKMFCECDGRIVHKNLKDLDYKNLETPNYLKTDWAIIEMNYIKREHLYFDIREKHKLSNKKQQYKHGIKKPVTFTLNSYLNSVSIYNEAYKVLNNDNCSFSMNNPAIGWCSWYQYFSNIDEQKLLSNLEQLSKIRKTLNPLKLFLIDDGYTAKNGEWGDWLNIDKTRFPNGIDSLVESMGKEDENFIPGLWIAPFAADLTNTTVERDWILKNHTTNELILSQTSHKNKKDSNFCCCCFKNTKYQVPNGCCNSGFTNNKFFYGLDGTNPLVLEHIKETIDTVINKWKFKYLKLDFLYASCLRDLKNRKSSSMNRFDETSTRASTCYNSFQFIRDTVGNDIYLLFCGSPLGPAIGVCNSMRIGSDIGTTWLPEIFVVKSDKNNIPCARNAVRNSICRLPMNNRLFLNDPDCLILRKSKDSKLTTDEIIGLATVNAFNGSALIISDDLTKIPQDRMKIAKKIMDPLINYSPVIHDLFTKEMPEILSLVLGQYPGNFNPSCLQPYLLLACCNWVNKKPKTVQILMEELGLRNDLEYDVFEFWTETYKRIKITNNKRNKLFTDILNDKREEDGIIDVKEKQIFKSDLVPVHSALIYSFRAATLQRYLNEYTYIGSNLHFSQGKEVKQFTQQENGKLLIELSLPYKTDGAIWIRCPPSSSIDTKTFEQLENNVVKIPVELTKNEENNQYTCKITL